MNAILGFFKEQRSSRAVKSLKRKLNVKMTSDPGLRLISHSVERPCTLSLVVFLLAIAFSVSYTRITLHRGILHMILLRLSSYFFDRFHHHNYSDGQH